MFVVDAGWESITLLLPPQDIREHLVARQRDDEFRLPHGVETLQADADKVRRLFDWGKRLVDTAGRQPALFNDGRRQRAAAHVELLEGLLAVLFGADDYEPTRDDRTRQAHGLIVKKVEDYVSHAGRR